MLINYLLIILATFAVAAGGSWLTSKGLPWYLNSNLPPLAPPGQIIGMVWTAIYAMSALSLILWFGQPARRSGFWLVVWLFVLNGVLNAGWSWLFFYNRWVTAALVEMLALEATVVLLIVLMWRARLASALLLLPYALWVVFATYLAYDFWRLNRG